MLFLQTRGPYQQVESRKVKEESELFREYFETEIQRSTIASNKAIGASLVQEVDQTENLIAASSRSLKPAELNYSTMRRELLAILFAVKKFNKLLHSNCRIRAKM